MPRIVDFDPGGLKIAVQIVPHLPNDRLDLRFDLPLSGIGFRHRCGAERGGPGGREDGVEPLNQNVSVRMENADRGVDVGLELMPTRDLVGA